MSFNLSTENVSNKDLVLVQPVQFFACIKMNWPDDYFSW